MRMSGPTRLAAITDTAVQGPCGQAIMQAANGLKKHQTFPVSASEGHCLADSGRFLARSQNHHHLPAFQLGHGFYLAKLAKIVSNPFKHTHAELLVRHFPTPETQGHFGFVALFKEALEVTQLHLVVTFVSTRTELDFLHLDGFLDRKSTRLNSSHVKISYAVFCL